MMGSRQRPRRPARRLRSPSSGSKRFSGVRSGFGRRSRPQSSEREPGSGRMPGIQTSKRYVSWHTSFLCGFITNPCSGLRSSWTVAVNWLRTAVRPARDVVATSKTLQVSRQARQHSIATRGRTARYRTTSSVNQAGMVKISRPAFATLPQCRTPDVDDSTELLAIAKVVRVTLTTRHQSEYRHHVGGDFYVYSPQRGQIEATAV